MGSVPQTREHRLRKLFIAGAVVLSVSACAYQSPSSSSKASAPTLPPTSATETTSSAPTTPPGPAKNARGNIEKVLGEEGGGQSADETPIFTFAVDAITPDIHCTAPYNQSEKVENGHLVGVKMRFSVAPVTTEQLGFFTVNATDFSFIGSDNLTKTNLETIAAYSCLSDKEKFTQETLMPGQQYAGTVVLDVPETSGTLIYKPSTFDPTSGGWEWHF